MAGNGATLAAAALLAVARSLDAAAKDLHAAPRGSAESEDAHMMYRAALCRWRAARVSAKAVDDDAATHARALCVAAEAVDAAAKRVAADVEFDVKLAARRDLEDAEAAFESLYEPFERARRPRPTSRAVRHRTINVSPRRRRRGASEMRHGARVPILVLFAVVRQRVVASQAKCASPRTRTTRCGICAGCRAEECGECTYCLDMRKRGGPGKLKRPCVQRACLTLTARRPCPTSRAARSRPATGRRVAGEGAGGAAAQCRARLGGRPPGLARVQGFEGRGRFFEGAAVSCPRGFGGCARRRPTTTGVARRGGGASRLGRRGDL